MENMLNLMNLLQALENNIDGALRGDNFEKSLLKVIRQSKKLVRAEMKKYATPRTEVKEFIFKRHKYYATHIPTATSEAWIVVISEVCDVMSIMLLDLNGRVIKWKNPPRKEFKKPIANKVRKLYGLKVQRKK